MDRFAVVAAVLLIPPVGVGITLVAEFGGRVDVAAILLLSAPGVGIRAR